MILTFVVRAALYKLCFFFFFFSSFAAFSPGQQNRGEISFNCLGFVLVFFCVFYETEKIFLKHGKENSSDLLFRFMFYFSNFWFYANVTGSQNAISLFLHNFKSKVI